MSALYGTVCGMRSERTARGSRNSGVRASCQSWSGSVILHMDLDEKENPIVTISTSDRSTSCWGDQRFSGTIKQLESVFQLMKDIEAGKVSVVRHRIKK